MSAPPDDSTPSAIAVCGLGTLGQYCVTRLKEFGVAVHAAELLDQCDWQLPGLPPMLDSLVTGDCRDPEVLARLNLADCRAILILTKDERVNIAAAFAARAINPRIRILVRSSQANLNELLGEHLGDFVAMEPTQLSANAFALDALGDETLGLFELDGRLIRVGTVRVGAGQPRLQGRPLHDFNSHAAKLLNVSRDGSSPGGFYAWDPDAAAADDDVLTYVEIDGEDRGRAGIVRRRETVENRPPERRTIGDVWNRVREYWTAGTQTQRAAALLCTIVIPAVFLLGAVLYKQHYKDISWHDALNVSSVLIIGGYDNIFGALKLPFPIPGWLHLFSFAQTVAGTLFVGIVYAFLTERVLSARFQFRRRRPSLPNAGHTIIIGMGRVGKAVATILDGYHQPLVATDLAELDADVLPSMPFIAGEPAQVLRRVNVERARCLMALTSDEVANLEFALTARASNPACELVIRTDDPYFSRNVSELVPRAHALGVNALAGEAFAAAAFGEDILSLFRIGGRTALVTDYTVIDGDQLCGRLISSVAYGYDVVPLLHERTAGTPPERAAKLFPTGDLRLYPGDRLVVLATMDGLQRVEHASLFPQSWRVRIDAAPAGANHFEAAMTIARLSGCEPEAAQAVLSRLPAVLDIPLHRHQALELVRALAKTLVEATPVQFEPAAAGRAP